MRARARVCVCVCARAPLSPPRPLTAYTYWHFFGLLFCFLIRCVQIRFVPLREHPPPPKKKKKKKKNQKNA